MCGRFTLTCSLNTLVTRFAVAQAAHEYQPRYNVAPTQVMPVVIMDGGHRSLVAMQWGLVPSWAKDPGIGTRMINARVETVADKPAYRAPFRRRRCLVPADGFYEWKKFEGSKRKQPYRFVIGDGGPFAFAGLYELWEGDNGSFLLTFSILTTQATGVVTPVHQRMPVILSPEVEAQWIDPNLQDHKAVLALLAVSSPELRGYPVDSAVGNSRNDNPELVRDIDLTR
ncbi:Putative SOS response-associated peptidase yoqW [Chlamydiales bacterium SCGC AG-110-P3]|nr:Putative SOS response-associated peptidase yoqW [Chlamydiales bacterium SCGC AG-110-P3]